MIINVFVFANKNIDKRVFTVFDQFEKNENKDKLIELFEDLEKYNYKLNKVSKTRISYLKLCYDNERYSLTKKSLPKIEEIIQEAKRHNDYYLIGVAYHFKAILDLYSKDYNESINSSLKAIEILKKINKEHSLIDSYYNLCFAYFNNKDWSLAIEAAKKSILYVNKLNCKNNRIINLNIRIAYSYIKLKKIKQAEKYLNYAILENPEIIKNNFWINIVYAEMYTLLEDHQKANEYYFNTLRINDINKKTKLEIFDKTAKKELNFKIKLYESKKTLLKYQQIAFFLILLFTSFSFYFLLKLSKLNKIHHENLSEIKTINNKLNKSNLNIETINSDLLFKIEKKKSLIKISERMLFSKILKISTYNDSIQTTTTEISKLIFNKKIKNSSLNRIKNNLSTIINDTEIWDNIQIQYENSKPSFFKKLKEIAPNLTINELKHCAYLNEGLTNKEVSNLIQISPRSVETARYRIKKKLNLKKEINLIVYIKNL